jgi:UDP-hydrolysing UDP-N-acetyl-D-glucosamine 2-epimerase
MTNKRICVVTGSRAEYGLLQPVMDALRREPALDLQVVATGMHLAPEYGLTVREIERDGFEIAERVDMQLDSDTPGGITRSVGVGLIGWAAALARLKPDLMLVLGDRFEILAAVTAALFHNVPVAHIAGGDVTEGAFDESIRHAITKMSHVHFATNEDAARRLRAMGEDPRRVIVTGSPGLDQLARQPLLDRPALEAALGAPLGRRNLLVTFHPVTLQPEQGPAQQEELLAALGALDPAATTLWFTRPNADTGSRALAARLDEWAASRPNVHVHTSLGHLRYLSLMAQADAVVGNSSSGLYEAPSLGVPTVDIGDRQRGRLAARSVLHCAPERGAIARALASAFALDCTGVVNPYGDGHASPRIVQALRDLPQAAALLQKPFNESGASHVEP